MTTGPWALRALIAANGLSIVGNGVAAIAIPWLVLEVTGSASAAGLVAAAGALPVIATAVLGGALVDRIGHVRASLMSDLASAVAVAAVPVVGAIWGLSLPALIILCVVGAALDPLAVIARDALLPVAAQQAGVRLERANGIHAAVTSAGFLAGPALGGAFIGLFGPESALWLTSGTFLLASAAIAAGPRQSPDAEAVRTMPFVQLVRSGFRILTRDRVLRDLALIEAALAVALTPLEQTVLPAHFQALGRPQTLGIVLATFAAGGIVGALVFSAFGHRVPHGATLGVGLLATGICIGGIGLLPPAGAMIALAAITGIVSGPITPVANLAFQTRTDVAERGRALGMLGGLSSVGAAVGLLLGSFLLSLTGIGLTALLLGGAFLLVAASRGVQRSVRRLDVIPDPATG